MSEVYTNGHKELESESDLGVTVVTTGMDMPLPDNSEGLRKVFIEVGGNTNWKRIQAGEREALARADSKIQVAKKANPFANASTKIGASMARISVGFIWVVFTAGLPISLIAVLFAEGFAITEGIALIAGDAAWVYAGALMVFLLVILFVYEVQHRSDNTQNEEAFSLRSLAGRLKYTIGVGSGWQPKSKPQSTPLRNVETAMVYVSRAIIFFGILGRLVPDLAKTDTSNWFEGIGVLLTQSNLQQMFGYVGNTLLAMTLLSSAHVVVYLIHRFYVLSTGGLDITSDGALGFLSVVNEEELRELELKQFYRDQIYLLKAHNDKQS